MGALTVILLGQDAFLLFSQHYWYDHGVQGDIHRVLGQSCDLGACVIDLFAESFPQGVNLYMLLHQVVPMVACRSMVDIGVASQRDFLIDRSL